MLACQSFLGLPTDVASAIITALGAILAVSIGGLGSVGFFSRRKRLIVREQKYVEILDQLARTWVASKQLRNKIKRILEKSEDKSDSKQELRKKYFQDWHDLQIEIYTTMVKGSCFISFKASDMLRDFTDELQNLQATKLDTSKTLLELSEFYNSVSTLAETTINALSKIIQNEIPWGNPKS